MGSEQNLSFFDFKRWMMGETPWWFLLEVTIRAIIVYVILLVTLRIMGRRVASQMTISELAIVVTLGAAVGVPMQAPDRGMLAAVVILVVAISVEWLMAWASFRSRRAEVMTQGDVLIIVEDSRILLKSLESAGLSRERLFSVLRSHGVQHLGEVRRVYAEASGDFSLLLYQNSRSGLSVLPLCDTKLRRTALTSRDLFACESCGYTRKTFDAPREACPHCHQQAWTEAISKVEDAEEHPEGTRD